MRPPIATKARVLAAVRASPSPTRQTFYRALGVVGASSVTLALALYFALDGARHGEGRSPCLYVTSALAWFLVGSASLAGTLARSGSAVGRRRGGLLLVILGGPMVLLLVMGGLACAFPEATTLHAERTGWRCLALTLVIASLPAGTLVVLQRGSHPLFPATHAAAVAAACGVCAGGVVDLWCPVLAVHHVVLGHVAPPLALAVVGAIAGALLHRQDTR